MSYHEDHSEHDEHLPATNGGFFRLIVAVVVLLVILFAFGVDLSIVWGYALTILGLLWQIVSLVLSFFIELLKAALDALRNLIELVQ
jgi:hypothetical protein